MAQQVRKHRKWLWVMEIVLVLVTGIVYVSNVSHASPEATALAAKAEVLDHDTLAFGSPEAKTGILFYPGARVEYTAYAPLMDALSQQGYLCLLVKMPLNLAILNIGAANGLKDRYPAVEHWYMAGHSLGGAMAAVYAADHAGDFEGLILLASYSTVDLKEKGVRVLSVYGSLDTVLSANRLNQYRANLPTDAQTTVIQGGNHAYFGDYGTQAGDGTATIPRAQQVTQTVDAISAFVGASEAAR